MIKSILVLSVSCFALTGCGPNPVIKLDQVKRVRLFKECMADLPVGPRSTQYNDWDEVVSQCDSTSWDQARICIDHCESSGYIQTVPEVQK